MMEDQEHHNWCQQFRPICCDRGTTTESACVPCRESFKAGQQTRQAEIERLQRPVDFPEVVCLCGSTRFMDAFFEAGWKLTLEGKIVLSVGVCKHAEHHGAEALGQDVADRLDELHLRKIDLADRVLILNVGGYIGESTRKEWEYACQQGKRVDYLEPAEKGEPTDG